MWRSASRRHLRARRRDGVDVAAVVFPKNDPAEVVLLELTDRTRGRVASELGIHVVNMFVTPAIGVRIHDADPRKTQATSTNPRQSTVELFAQAFLSLARLPEAPPEPPPRVETPGGTTCPLGALTR